MEGGFVLASAFVGFDFFEGLEVPASREAFVGFEGPASRDSSMREVESLFLFIRINYQMNMKYFGERLTERRQ